MADVPATGNPAGIAGAAAGCRNADGDRRPCRARVVGERLPRVYVVDESQPVRRVAFANGTLPGHAECGEEVFSVEMDESGNVWYDLRAYSRPRHWLARLGYPLTRKMQRRFAVRSAAAMERATSQDRVAVN